MNKTINDFMDIFLNNPSKENEINLIAELKKTKFIAPVIINQALAKPDGNAVYEEEGSNIRFITLVDDDTQKNFFPSPAVFVYTLPNIVTGEVAIKHKTYGETAFYALEKKDDVLIHHLLQTVCCDTTTEKIIGGWLEYESEDCFEADLCLYQIGK